jgi:putative SOS response-associated peptidase YedK
MPIVRPHGNGRELAMAGWGLIAFWMKDLSRPAYSTINARAETIRTSPTFREPFAKRRCIVPATGWSEWQDLGKKKKRPVHMCARAKPFAFAGVWDVWKGEAAPAGITSFAFVTTEAAPSVRAYPFCPRPVLCAHDEHYRHRGRSRPHQSRAGGA